jgi:hypothetical protein
MSTTIHNLITSDLLAKELASALPLSKEVTIISAYVTEPAAMWVSEHVSKRTAVTLVGRYSPQDVAAGASSLETIKKGIKLGWDVRILPSLHAKIYLIDKHKLYVGSANLTVSGLLLYGEGNIETSVRAEATQTNIDFVKRIIDSAHKLDFESYERMALYMKENVEVGNNAHVGKDWPDSIVPIRNSSIWVTDFPWSRIENNRDSICEHDLDLFGPDESLRNEKFISSRGYRWLVDLLSEEDGHEIYFGSLTALLHDALSDDPSPYRKNVKQLVANLLSYCRIYATQTVVIDRPSYSERVKLL